MKHGFISLALAASICLLSASLSLAAEKPPVAAGDAGSMVQPGVKSPLDTKELVAIRRKAAARIKLVDINGASKKQLMKLPNIGAAEADRIVAGRPYGSKAWLVTRNIVSDSIYFKIKSLIIAKQPFNDGAKNAAIYSKKQ